MDRWKRYRLLACIGVTIVIFAAAGMGRLIVGVPEAPYGTRALDVRIDGEFTVYVTIIVPRKLDPFIELRRDMDPYYYHLDRPVSDYPAAF